MPDQQAPDTFELMDEWGPERIVCVSDSRTGMRGVLVVDNTARGIGKGGTRMSPTVTVGEIARLARVMTWKWAAGDLFFGGAKAGIVGDPTAANKEEILRAFARALADEIPSRYVVGLDMGLTEGDAAIVADELGDRSAAVGLPAELGGVPYDEMGVTGFGVAEATEAAAELVGVRLAGARVAVQGFGAVGAATARRLVELGAVVVAVSTVEGGIHDPDGLDVAELLRLRDEAGDACVLEYTSTHSVARTDVGVELLAPADILVPAAREDVVDERLAAELPARLIVEGANLPLTPAAQAVLAGRGVSVVPDFIANAGGTIAAAFAMDARSSPFRPEAPVIFARIASTIRANTTTVLERAKSDGGTTHDAARALAQERVRAAMELRGRIPKGPVG